MQINITRNGFHDYRYVKGASQDRAKIPKVLRLIILARQLCKCALCSDKICDSDSGVNQMFNLSGSGYKQFHWGHIVPKSWLGEDSLFNAIAICPRCNIGTNNDGKGIGMGNEIFFYVIWTAFRFGKSIAGFPFSQQLAIEYNDYIDRNGHPPSPWVSWGYEYKEKSNKRLPNYFGYDLKNDKFNQRESFDLEGEIFLRNIRDFVEVSRRYKSVFESIAETSIQPNGLSRLNKSGVLAREIY